MKRFPGPSVRSWSFSAALIDGHERAQRTSAGCLGDAVAIDALHPEASGTHALRIHVYTFSEGTWALQAYINSLQSPSEKVLGSLGMQRPANKFNNRIPSGGQAVSEPVETFRILTSSYRSSFFNSSVKSGLKKCATAFWLERCHTSFLSQADSLSLYHVHMNIYIYNQYTY